MKIQACLTPGISKLFFTEGHFQNNAPKFGPVAKEKAYTTPLSCIDVSTSIRLRFLTEYKENTNFHSFPFVFILRTGDTEMLVDSTLQWEQ